MTPELTERISRCRLRLLYALPFFGGLVARCDIQSTDRAPTARIFPSGLIQINEDYVKELSDGQLAWVLTHEVLHAALLYWARQKHRTVLLYNVLTGGRSSLWNIAHDHVVNLILWEMYQSPGGKKWLEPLSNMYMDHQYKDWTGEAVYDHLLVETPTLKDFLDDAVPGGMTPEEKAKWEQNILQAFHEHGRQAGLPRVILDIIKELQSPTIPWGQQLSQWLGDNFGGADYSYRRPSRRRESETFIFPSVDRRNATSVIILWDVSGSMTGMEEAILSEVQGILEALQTSVTLVVCDTEVRAHLTLKDAHTLANIEGGGGSNFIPAFQAITDRNSLIIAFTDGEITVPTDPPPNPVLWVLTQGGVNPTGGKWGQTIYMPMASARRK